MVIKLYNTLSRTLEEFKPLNPPEVTLYTCGPTVYNFPHIGNYRAYLFGDFLKRTLTYSGFAVRHIMNITDIDDKTIRDSQKAGQPLLEFTEHFTQEFYKDRDALNIIPADKYTKATAYVANMLLLIEKLIKNGYAYKGDDNSIYFSIAKDKDYGKLAHLDRSKLAENASGRMRADEYEKDNAQDFALWKAWDEADGDVYWEPSELLGRETVLVKGRPGWHIECSAMSMAELGESIDIHTGGVDNMFPHHENEIAQSECATGKPFVKYWMHNEWLLVDGKKMSKSAGNFYTLRDVMEKSYNPIVFRYMNLLSHYRTPLNFSWDSMDAAKEALTRLYGIFRDLPDTKGSVIEKYKQKFTEAISNDLNISLGLATLWELTKDTDVSPADKRTTMLDFDKVLGLNFQNIKEETLPEEIQSLIKQRDQARMNKNWTESDSIRDQLVAKGYEVKDTDSGTKVSKKL